MPFSAFSKEFAAVAYTSVENQFITKYLPRADGDAVRAYLFGLYLCSCPGNFDGASVSKLLKIPPERLAEIFGFWEECDLVHILSRDPLFVEYLPVNAAVGKPKPIRAEKYTEFNRELLRRLQKVGKDLKPYEMGRILEFLENNPMEPQAFLLITEYCVKKDGEKVSAAHLLNKAKKLCAEQKFTYEQVEQDLSDYNAHERELSKIFTLLGIYRKPQEQDYDFLEKWLSMGMEPAALFTAAGTLKKGTLASLDVLVGELHEKGIRTGREAEDYLALRAERADAVYRVARKLGVRVQNPRAYVEEYAEKWLDRGYDTDSLLRIAGLCFKLRYGFAEMDTLLDALYASGIVDETGVGDYCLGRERQLRLLQSVQAVCGIVKKTTSSLDMIAAWQSWNFSDKMILEAAKRSAGAAAPLAYMNKLLSEWKRAGVFSPEAIPEKQEPSREYKNEAAVAADLRSERERHYATLRQAAMEAADRARARADSDEAFTRADAAVRKGEIALAKAEVYSPDTVPSLKEALKEAQQKRRDALSRLGLSPSDFEPKFHCPKCSDTGFLPDGRACDCYQS